MGTDAGNAKSTTSLFEGIAILVPKIPLLFNFGGNRLHMLTNYQESWRHNVTKSTVEIVITPQRIWASEASPTLGCSIEISRDILCYVGMSVCLSWSKKRRRKYVCQTRACSKSVLCGKIRPVTPVLLISTIRYSSFSMDGR